MQLRVNDQNAVVILMNKSRHIA